MMQAGLEEGAAAVEKERARVTKIISDKVMIDMVNMMVVMVKMRSCEPRRPRSSAIR